MPWMTRSWQARAALGGSLLAAVVLAAGCGSTVAEADPVTRSAVEGAGYAAALAPGVERPRVLLERTPRPPRPAPASCRGGVLRPVGSPAASFAGVARRSTVARVAPNGRIRARFPQLNANGHVTVFGIRGLVRDGCRRLWYRVALPMRPNGAHGFVMARDVRVVRVVTRIVVDLSERRLTLFRSGQPVIRSVVAVGSPSTPTPTGRYYVNQRLLASDPAGPWGPGAIGISAFSEVLTDWPQGGPIAIHGTNDPSSIGSAASHGCVRVPNGTLRRMLAATPAGTPAVIRE